MGRIIRMSRLLRRLTLGLFWALPIYNVLFWMSGGRALIPAFDLNPVPHLAGVVPTVPLAVWQRFAGCAVTMLPMGLAMWGLLCLHRLFGRYAQLELFSVACVRDVRAFAWVLVTSQLLYPVYCGLISLVVTLANPIGERVISIAFGPMQVVLLAVGVAILVVAWIMDEGRKLDEEVRSTI